MSVLFAAALAVVSAAAAMQDPAVPPAPPEVIAVLPAENLSGAEAPMDAIQAALRVALQDRGLELLPEENLAGFMNRQRLRYVGGLATEMGRALRAETGAMAVLVSSVDLFEQDDPPRFALTARLVTTGEEPRIAWMDSAAATGDEKPGFLGLGHIADVGILEGRVVETLADSLAASLSTAPPAAIETEDVPRRYRPRSLYRAPADTPQAAPETTAADAAAAETPVTAPPPAGEPAPRRVAVLPFANDSTAKNAGDLVTLEMVRQARLVPGVEVIEPGVVREALLRAHLIQEEGLSLPQADLVRLLLEADLVLFGDVSLYVEAWAGEPEPEVDFSARVLSTRTRQAVCAALSHARGDDGAWFFGLRRVPTARLLTARLARGFVAGCLDPAQEERP
ncbi:MAG TPA: hypothetical protein VGS03_20680 [Candidatus Polarisedimenticolia bacterium]|nr:hypothetical protein [Candidatus Polarisedimenticolia bacterium]